MKTLLVQDYLRSGKTLNDLKYDHKINYCITNGKISLNYDMIESKNTDPLACQCRGLILEENSYNIISYGMDRFFNLSETNVAAKIDLDNSTIENKEDGTCIFVYYYLNTWNCATRSRSEADVPIDGNNLTFTNLVNAAINKQFNLPDLQIFMNSLFPNWAQNYTFIFELTTPLNRIVCKYDDFKLILLAVRNKITLAEENPIQWSRPELGLKTPEIFSFSSTEDMIETIKTWDPSKREGVVVKDINFNRVKVKNPSYVAINKLRDSLSTSLRGCLEIILLGKDDDVIGFLPEFIVNRINKLKPAVQEVLTRSEKEFNEIKHIDNMKDFARVAEFKLWPSAMYALKRNKTPNIKTFALGNNKLPGGKISHSAIDTLLLLCHIIDPDLKKIN